MNTTIQSSSIILEPADNRRLANLCGQFDEHLRQIEQRLGVEINNRGNTFKVIGETDSVQAAEALLRELYNETDKVELEPSSINLLLQQAGVESYVKAPAEVVEDVAIKTQHGIVRGRGPNQKHYLSRILSHDINFGVGPAGTGKTYLAVASAVAALQKEQVDRIILTRPAVESGERLGFLPGDLSQKIDPYLRPLYDALYEMLGFDYVAKLIERNVIEVAPLAYMRGRSLNDSFIILDEAQNTTVEQMKMFLTRIGFGSKVIVTGDVTQVDLPRGQRSGLRHVIDVLVDVKEISFTFFKAKDVVRHPLVQQIVTAYQNREDEEASLKSSQQNSPKVDEQK
ncbi:Phosphate starvation-inducible protein PhoH, predicted ATPase [hydrothermal vent metagenome]|uniref:PhoH-like protein n=1 Tax=hydrothermal vent metagenome TaxID=652676 RepID=A0A3B1AAS2_9ZZZZ